MSRKKTSWDMFTKRIAKRNPPQFTGKEDPIQLGNWIREFDKLFTVLEFPDEQRVKHAVFYLHGNADYWWLQNKAAITAQPDFSWEVFKVALRDQFYPICLRKMNYFDFLHLEMGDNMTVEEYYHKFVELMQLVPEMVHSEKMQALKFELGLTTDIRLRLQVGIFYPSLDVIYGEAKEAEENITMIMNKSQINSNNVNVMPKRLKCPDEQSTKHAIFYLQEDADYWWCQNESAITAQPNFGAEVFERALQDQVCTINYRKMKYFEFIHLEMGDNMTVQEYYCKFVELMRLVPEMVHTEKMKALKFELGLTTDIQLRLLGGKFYPSLDVIYDKAREVDEKLTKIMKRQINCDNNFGYDNGDYGNSNDKNGSDWQERVHRCNNCFENHPGKDCKGRLVKCRGCGKLGHFEYECWAPGNRYGNIRPKRFTGYYQRNENGGQINQFVEGNNDNNGYESYQGQGSSKRQRTY